ncbi:MAG: TonB-dependent receptor [Gemmataceae bacterium]|nr:TonB-dependent receptor [Gemmataceae bacterium]
MQLHAGLRLFPILVVVAGGTTWAAAQEKLPPPTAQPAPAAQPPQLPELPPTRVEGARTPVAVPVDLAQPAAPPFGTPSPGSFNLRSNLLGRTYSAGSGFANQSDLQFRPYVRTSEILEIIPGFVVFQHAGGGKAAQFVLRGVNMDHGTDFALFVDGQPINLPTHCHGQGYLDMNFVIPELIESFEFRRGCYYADVGDFGATGTAAMRLATRLTEGFAKLEAGMFNYYRAVAADSFDLGPGHFLFGIEGRYHDTPFVLHENLNRFSAIGKYSLGDERAGLVFSGYSYQAKWDSTDQQPYLAIEQGLIGRFGTLDPSLFGETYRHGGIADTWLRWGDNAITRANFYATWYHLNLFTNPEFFDEFGSAQIQQREYRRILGGGINHTFTWNFGAKTKMTQTVGLQVRNDYLPEISLYNTDRRRFVSTITDDRVNETNVGLFYSNDIQIGEKLRALIGVRQSFFDFDVSSRTDPRNSGRTSEPFTSPSVNLVAGPFNNVEYFLNLGIGFHSNDARGVLARFNPDGTPVIAAPGLVRARGAEVGIRSGDRIPGLVTTLTAFYLDLESELIFSGDAGTVEPRGGSRRAGLEFSAYYNITKWWSVDIEGAWVRGRFEEPDEDGGRFIPGAIPVVITGGTQLQAPNGLIAGIRGRYFSPQALISNNSLRSEQVLVFNGILGYQRNRLTVGVEGINLFNARAPDVSYAYPFRLSPGGPEILGKLFRPTEPLQARFFLIWTF